MNDSRANTEPSPPSEKGGVVGRAASSVWCFFLLFVAGILVVSMFLRGLAGFLFDSNRDLHHAVLSGDMYAMSTMTGRVVGVCIVAIIALLLGRVAAKRRGRPSGKLFAGFVLVGLGMNVLSQLVPGLGLGPQGVSASQARAVVESAEELNRAYLPTDGSLPTAPQQPLASEETHGLMAPVVNATQNYMAQLTSDRTAYELKLAQLRLEQVLLPSRLESSADIVESRAKIATAKKLSAEHAKSVAERIRAYYAAAEAIEMPLGPKQEILQGLADGLKHTRAGYREIGRYDAAIFDETDALLEFMQSQIGTYVVTGDQLLFDTDEQVVAYQLSVARIDALAGRQIEFIAAIEDQLRERTRGGASGNQSMPVTAKLMEPVGPDRLVIEPEQITLNGQRIATPLSLADLTLHLGEPEVVEMDTDDSAMYLWRERGVYGASGAGDDRVDWVSFLITDNHHFDDIPKSSFTGTIQIGTVTVDEFDTPATLNRRLQGVEFVNYDGLGEVWGIDIPGGAVSMLIEPNGLSREINIVTAHVPEPKSPARF